MIEPRTCLVIDDDIDDHLFFSMAMQEVMPQMTCIFSTNCPDAINRLKDRLIPPPDLVFVDLNMPGMTPHQCLSVLRQIPELENSSFFVLSGAAKIYRSEDLVPFRVKKVIAKQASIEGLGAEIYSAVCSA